MMEESIYFTEPHTGTPFPRVKLRYLEHMVVSRALTTSFHTHSFWQFELVISGSPRVRMGGAVHALRQGRMLFIPPGVRHQFAYEPQNVSVEYVSVKFESDDICEGFEERFLDDRVETSAVRDHLTHIIDTCRSEVSRLTVLIRSSISALLSMTYLVESPRPSHRPWSSKVLQALYRRQMGRTTAGAVAAGLGYSRGHLSQLLRSEVGMSLKPYLDQELAREAKRLLRFSDLTVGEIASSLRFPDLYSFSRFFSRMAGESPSEHRKRTIA